MSREVVAIIPARGGSKGILRKNVKRVAGKPLVAYSIEQALMVPSISRVFVSTDDVEIASVAETYGAEVIWRPDRISGDCASSESALIHAVGFLQQEEDYQPDLVVFLQCTAPLTLAEDIEGTINALLNKCADSALAVTPFHYFLWREDKDGGVVGINHDKRRRLRRQDREPQYLETGAVYVMRTEGFLRARHRFFGKTAMYVMPAERCLEIDDLTDLQIADVLMRQRQREARWTSLPAVISGLVLDFDGVFTDNRVFVYQDGRESVVCDRSDGWGLAQLKERELPILVLSSEKNPVVQARCDKLNLECVHGLSDKTKQLAAWLEKRELDPKYIIYLGNDVNDLGCMRRVGCSVAVADAHPEVLGQADVILSRCGGRGAVRELCDKILQHRKELDHNA